MPTLTDGPGAVVRARREELRLTQMELAVAADVSVPTLWRLENENRIPKPKLLARIAERLDLDVDQLLDGTRS